MMTSVTDWKNLLMLGCGLTLAVGGFSTAGAEWSGSSITDWIQALATGAALLAAAVAALYAAGVFGLEEDRDDAREKAEAQLQAEKVAAWFSYAAWNPKNDSMARYGKFYLRNASDLPVYNLTARSRHVLTLDGSDLTVTKGMHLDLVPPDYQEHYDAGWITWNFTPEVQDRLDSMTPIDRKAAKDASSEEHRIELTFTDTGGRTWRRGFNGHLKQVGEPAAG